jgi:serine/threonine protein kinase
LNWAIDSKKLKFNDNECDRLTDEFQGQLMATYHGLDVQVEIMKAVDSALDEHTSLPNEMAALAQSRHPNIIAFLGASFCGESCLIVTEYLPAGCMETLLAQPSWSLSNDKILSWSLDIARAVNYLHRSDPVIIHRDLRPGTLSISKTGALKISRFGRCKFVSSPEPAAARNPDPAENEARAESYRPQLGFDAGPTPALSRSFRADRPDQNSVYVAPELLRDPDRIDEKSDIYSVAMIMRRLRAGTSTGADSRDRPAPPPISSRKCSGRGGTGRADSETRLALALEAVADWASAEDPAGRPTSEELLAALEGSGELEASCPQRCGGGGCTVC